MMEKGAAILFGLISYAHHHFHHISITDKIIGLFFKCCDDQLYCNYLFICSQPPLSSQFFKRRTSEVPIYSFRKPGSMPERLLTSG